jgi:hypothetical protein
LYIRDIRKVRKRQHQYPEFGHTQGKIQKKPAKKYISIQETIFDGFLSFFFSLSASTAAAATKIFTAPTFTATIISLEPCALNAEIHEFQHFILRFNKISFLCGYH